MKSFLKVALRVIRICSEPEDLDKRLEELHNFLKVLFYQDSKTLK